MAKRKKREEVEEEEKDYGFEEPDFDRIEYMKGEIRKGKSILVSVAVAPLFSLIALQLFILINDWTVALIGGLSGLVVLIPLMRTIGINTDELGKKELAMDVAMFFFTFLAIWVILMNPPVNDFAHPKVHDDLDVLVQEGDKWVEMGNANITNNEEYNITFRAKITDNVDVKDDSIKIGFSGQPPEIYKDKNSWPQMEKDGKNHYTMRFDEVRAKGNAYTLKFYVEDVNGNSATITRNVIISSQS